MWIEYTNMKVWDAIDLLKGKFANCNLRIACIMFYICIFYTYLYSIYTVLVMPMQALIFFQIKINPFLSTAPVSGGMKWKHLQEMGWRTMCLISLVSLISADGFEHVLYRGNQIFYQCSARIISSFAISIHKKN